MQQIVDQPITSQPGADRGSVTATDEAAVRNLPHLLAEAWASGDADAYAAIFTLDADYILFDGSHSRGRREIADIHRPVFERFLKSSLLVVESVEVRFLGPDLALIHSSGGVQKHGQSKVAKHQRSVQTMVAVRHEGGWRITAFQNTRYKPFTDTLVWKIVQLLPTGRSKSS